MSLDTGVQALAERVADEFNTLRSEGISSNVVVGYASGPPANQTGIQASVDITDLTVTFDARPDRLYRTTVHVSGIKVTAAGQVVFAIVNQAGTTIRRGTIDAVLNEDFTLPFSILETGLSGSQTRKAQAFSTNNSVTVYGAGTDYRGYIIVEDLGPASGSVPANPVGCRVGTSSYVLPNNAATAIPLDTEAYDPYGMHDTVTNTTRITIPAAGLYAIGGALNFNNFGAGTRYAEVRKNGTTALTAAAATDSTGTIDPWLNFSDIHNFAAGDYIEVVATQVSGGGMFVGASLWCLKADGVAPAIHSDIALHVTNDATGGGSGLYVAPFAGETVEGGQIVLEGAGTNDDIAIDNYNGVARIIINGQVPLFATDADLRAFNRSLVVGPSTTRRMVQQGGTSFTTDANGLSGTITFPTAFSATPTVTFTAASSSTTFIGGKLHSISSTGFEVRIFGGSPPVPSNNGNINIHWIAVGSP